MFPLSVYSTITVELHSSQSPHEKLFANILFHQGRVDQRTSNFFGINLSEKKLLEEALAVSRMSFKPLIYQIKYHSFILRLFV